MASIAVDFDLYVRCVEPTSEYCPNTIAIYNAESYIVNRCQPECDKM